MSELLLPAGNLEKLTVAYDYGADAVYAGLPRYSLRARHNEFRLEQLAAALQIARARGKRLYATCNILPHNDKVRSFLRQLQPLVDLRPDALIMADPGLILLAREQWPDLAIHLSVQANTLNYTAVRFWQKVGVRRIILSRELSLTEIEDIRQQCPDMELEVFVHGALCIAYSGRCLLSGYFNRRDSNQGTCTNACRWNYKLRPGDAGGDAIAAPLHGFDLQHELQADAACSATGHVRHPLADGVYQIEEAQRPGEWMPIEEDEHGTYILNSKDLRAIEHVQQLVAMGVDSLKIEGRTKSAYYVARTCQSYRQAIDDAVAGRPLDPRLLSALEGLANRGYTAGFYERHPDQDYQNYLRGHSESERSLYVGDVLGYDAGGMARIAVKNRFSRGDRLEVIHPGGNLEIQLETLLNQEGAPVEVAPGSGHEVRMPLPAGLERAFIARFV